MVAGSSVITGYYRYTDIWFEWHKVLPNPEDGRHLKAILSHDALVHPDHPLHIEGVEGVELFMGTFTTGELRLLFSSAQVDYIRYWLHAMKLTKDLIPVPYSDCLLTTSDLKYVSRVVYPDGRTLRAGIKQIDKNNKRLKGANPTLASRRHTFERVRTLWGEQKGMWCALDFEAWEYEHQIITEFGWDLIYWKDKQPVYQFGHWIVDEYQQYRNGKYVPDCRYNYNFGESEIVRKTEFKNKVSSLIADLKKNGPVYLVFHDNNQDIKYLKSTIQAPLDDLSYLLPDDTPTNGVFVVDTADLFAALEGDSSSNRRSLDRMCKHLQIPTEYLHNAGNDAHYTLEALKLMASGDPVDIQREKRWPNRTGAGPGENAIKVQFHPWEEDSDYSDNEGISYMSGYAKVPEAEGMEESA
ncbi:hypothetical protein AX16_001031 [Volvariella volvacea WC 439]|nr:hypothetical protein AX16_001031 [Volvariella volvacea WC 439]